MLTYPEVIESLCLDGGPGVAFGHVMHHDLLSGFPLRTTREVALTEALSHLKALLTENACGKPAGPFEDARPVSGSAEGPTGSLAVFPWYSPEGGDNGNAPRQGILQFDVRLASLKERLIWGATATRDKTEKKYWQGLLKSLKFHLKPSEAIESQLAKDAPYTPRYALLCHLHQTGCEAYRELPLEVAAHALLLNVIGRLTNHIAVDFIHSVARLELGPRSAKRLVDGPVSAGPLPRLHVSSNLRTVHNLDVGNLALEMR